MGKAIALILLSLLFGAGGSAIRYFELGQGFDALGLPLEGNIFHGSLIVLSVFFAVLSVMLILWMGIGKVRMHKGATVKCGAFCFLLCIVAAAALFANAYGKYATGSFYCDQNNSCIMDQLATALLALSALCILIMGILFLTKGKLSGYLLLVPVLALCVLLVAVFKEWCADPIILHFVYRLLAVIATLLSAYFLSAIAFRQAKAVPAVISSMWGIYLGCVSLPDSGFGYAALLMFCILYCSFALAVQIRYVHGWKDAHDDDIIHLDM